MDVQPVGMPNVLDPPLQLPVQLPQEQILDSLTLRGLIAKTMPANI
jgi:hypothetical protein